MEPDRGSREPARDHEADGASARSANGPRWTSTTARLTVLGLCLLLAIAALLDNRGVFAGSVAGARTAAACDGQIAPEAQPLDRREAARLRGMVLAVFADRGGQLYESGAVGTPNLWSDNQPRADLSAGGYEARWWALEPEGRQDDVVVDVLRYRSSAAARAVLALAMDPRCRREAETGTASLTPGGRTLVWINPDAAYQHDTMLVRGNLLYRVSATPATEGDGPAARAQRKQDRVRIASLTDVLACSLPAAGCAPQPLAREAATAGPPALARPHPAPRWPLSVAQARRYLHAVELRPFDIPWMTAFTRARSDASTSGPLPDCLHRLAGDFRGAAATSPALSYRRGLIREAAFSYAWLLSSEADARRVISTYDEALGDGCLAREYKRAVAHTDAHDRAVRIEDIRVEPLATPAPESDKGEAPYRATAVRFSMQVAYRTRTGRTVRLPFFEQATLFAYHRVLVTFTAQSTREPFSDENRKYVESVLLGRAETNWGLGG